MEFLATPEFGQLVTNVLVALASLLITAVGGAVTGFVRSRTTAQQWSVIQSIVTAAVRAAESAGITGDIVSKKSAALAAAQAMLASRGIKIDANALDAAIEAAVLEQFNYWKVDEEIQTKVLAAEATRGDRAALLIRDIADEQLTGA